MRLASIAFVSGAWLLQQQAQLLPSGWLVLATFVALLLWVGLSRQRVWLRSSISIIAFMLLGLSWANWRADLRLQEALPKAMEGQDVVVIGTVDTLPYFFDQGVRFNFTVEQQVQASGQQRIPTHLVLGWYRNTQWADDDNDANSAPFQDAAQAIQPGERWQLTVRLRQPHGNANPDGFDYEYWLLEQNLRATGYVRPSREHVPNRRLDAFVWSFSAMVERARALLRKRIQTALPDAPYAGVLSALVVGDQRGIDQSDWQVYNRTGIGHLISISGLHITMIAGLAAALVFALWRRSARLMFRLPAHKAAALAGASIALLYCLLAGFGVPAQRTLYMLSIVALALWSGHLTSASRVLCAALFIVVLLDPWAVMAAGFWLSFGAVAAIFYVSVGRVEEQLPADARWQRKFMHMLQQGARIQWAVTLGLMPLTLLLFHQVSIISPVANAIAIPLVSLVVTPLALLGALLSAPWPNVLATLLLQAAHGLMAALASWLGWMSAQPLAVWSGAAPAAWTFVCALIGVAWCLAPRGVPLRVLGLLWLVPLFAWPPDRPAAGSMRLTALDVGQGMAVLIETAHHNVLYDTGPQYSTEGDNNAGQRVILPFLRARGIDHLDALIVSHNDNDHSGGALSILRQLPVAQVYSSLAEDSAIVQSAGTRHQRCALGQAWSFDDLHFAMLHPLSEDYLQEGLKPNARSCVLRLQLKHKEHEQTQEQAVLLVGDIEAAQERALLQRATADELRAQILLVPHHGSLTSSTPAFIDAVQPELALIQSGYRNRFGHPKAEVLERYRSRGVALQRNDEGGAITVVLDGEGRVATAYRETHRRYWYGR